MRPVRRGGGWRTAVTAAALTPLFAAMCAAGGPPADPAYVTGSGALADDWQNQRWLRAGVPPSDLVGLWQSVLWADGYLPKSAITCAYDTETGEATRKWQGNHDLSADGIVGPASFGFAGRRLAQAPPWTVYRGEKYDLPLRRGRGGIYEVYDAGRFHGLRSDAVTLAVCRR
ncbi:peptidoglycan-binding protein [Streptomyces sp. NPDC005336]|uniref:peptidoglycan-binding domain-containing protein n=1 Tax=Streptomyces sp. NPDC005336 TaxID=3157035 RepID=UPI0033B6713E